MLCFCRAQQSLTGYSIGKPWSLTAVPVIVLSPRLFQLGEVSEGLRLLLVLVRGADVIAACCSVLAPCVCARLGAGSALASRCSTLAPLPCVAVVFAGWCCAGAGSRARYVCLWRSLACKQLCLSG